MYKCDLINDCLSFSYSNENEYGNLYNRYTHQPQPNSFFIMKNSFYNTSTTTTSLTTSLTNTSSISWRKEAWHRSESFWNRLQS